MATALETAQTRLDAYLAREVAILSAGQDTAVASRRRRDADLSEIRAAIKELQAEIERLGAGGSAGRIYYNVDPR